MSSQQLVEVCRTGDTQSLQILMTQHPGQLDVNLASEGGVTLLMHAIIGAGGKKRAAILEAGLATNHNLSRLIQL